MKLAWVIALVLMLIGFAILFRPPRIDETMAPAPPNSPTSDVHMGELDIKLPERVQVPAAGRLEVILDEGQARHSWTAPAPRAVNRDDIDWSSNRLVVPRVPPGDYTVIVASAGSSDARTTFQFTRDVSIRSGGVSVADFSAE
jgi:hypothetical protein